MNEWVFGGELFRLNELDGGFGASLRIRGTSRRGGVSQICELSCLVPKDVFEDFRRRMVTRYDRISVKGHVETWQRQHGEKMNIKQMFIVDELTEVRKKGVRV